LRFTAEPETAPALPAAPPTRIGAAVVLASPHHWLTEETLTLVADTG
jgi:hypothetical protein